MDDILEIKEEDEVIPNQKEMRKLKNPIRKRMNKAIRNRDYETFEECIEFLKQYDINYKEKKYEKYMNKYFKKIPKEFLDIIEKREKNRIKLLKLEELNFNIYDTFEKVIVKKLMSHINLYVDKKLNIVRREIIKEKAKPVRKRMKGKPKAPIPSI